MGLCSPKARPRLGIASCARGNWFPRSRPSQTAQRAPIRTPWKGLQTLRIAVPQGIFYFVVAQSGKELPGFLQSVLTHSFPVMGAPKPHARRRETRAGRNSLAELQDRAVALVEVHQGPPTQRPKTRSSPRFAARDAFPGQLRSC